ncbi:MAG: phosphatase PAP2 family protein [Ardenticatenaceae bacterium]
MVISTVRQRDANARDKEETTRSGFVQACVRIGQELGSVPRYRVGLIQGLFTLLALALTMFFAWQWPLPLDPRVQAASGGWLYQVLDLISLPGFAPWNAVMVAIVCAVVALWLGWQHGVYLVLLTLFQGFVSLLLKILIPIERPAEVDVNAPVAAINKAFPSGHVMLFVVFFGFLFYLVSTRLSRSLIQLLLLGLFTIMIVLGGASRLYLGAHWPVDVIGAQIIGFIILVVGIEIYERAVAPQMERTYDGEDA